MKYLFSVGLAAMFCCIMLAGFWRVHVSETSEEAGVVETKLDSLTAGWEAKEIPFGQRAVTVVISDANQDLDVLALPEQPSVMGRLWGWLKRAFGPKPSAALPDSTFAAAFSADPNTITWTHEGFATASEARMTRELMKTIVKAHDAGAELDIVTQGVSVVPVLKAIKNLEGTVRGGEKVGVNKLVSVGMSPVVLLKFDPVFFANFRKPGDLLEWGRLWTTEAFPKTTIIESSDASGEASFKAEELFPAWNGHVSVVAPIIKKLVSSHEPMERQLKAQAVAAIPAQPERTFRNAAGHVFTQEAPAAVAVQQPGQDSLSMITGGREYSEEAKKTAQVSQNESGAQAGYEMGSEHGKGVQWVTIQGGTFIMGQGNGRHQVNVKTFQMAKTLVTNAQYKACVAAGACISATNQGAQFAHDDQPVVGVGWDQAESFSHWVGGRLPSEAEWEYAARSGGKDQDYPWGNEPATCARAVIKEGGNGCNVDATWPVCSKPAGNTAQGLCDMAGNAFEWVQDVFHDGYDGAPTDGSAWESYSGFGRVARGSSYGDEAISAHVTRRSNFGADKRFGYLSFRPAR